MGKRESEELVETISAENMEVLEELKELNRDRVWVEWKS